MKRTMQIPLQITARNVELSEPEEQMIRPAAGKLDLFCDRITSCRVLVDVPRRRRRTGMSYNVRLDLGVPAGEIAITRRARASWSSIGPSGPVGTASRAARNALSSSAAPSERCRAR
jgi:hypothetical protein